MDIATMEDRIKESMLILDSDFEKITSTKDQQAQVGILARMVARQNEVDAILTEQSKLLTSWLRIPKTMNDADRVARRLLAFEFASKLADIVSDEMGDVKFHNRIVRETDKLVRVLDTVKPDGRSVLAPFLHNPDARVSGSAAAYLGTRERTRNECRNGGALRSRKI
jgi:hypothetical protein